MRSRERDRLALARLASLLVLAVCLSLAGIGLAQDSAPLAITSLAVAPDDTSLVVGSQAGVSLRGIKSKDSSVLGVKLDHVLCLAFAPDGKTLAIGGGRAAEAGIVELWSWPDKKLLGKLEGHTDLIHDVTWLPDGKTLATASADRTIRVWHFPAKETKTTLTGHSGPVLAVVALPDGKTVCSGSVDQTIRVWNVSDGTLVRSLDNHLGAVYALAIRPGRHKDEPVTLASAGGDKTVRIWQPALGRQVRIVRHPAPVFAIAWSRDGSILATAGKDGMLRSIDGDSDKVIYERQVSKGWIISLCRQRQSDGLVMGTTLGEIRDE
jgi:WD40 repeat protein